MLEVCTQNMGEESIPDMVTVQAPRIGVVGYFISGDEDFGGLVRGLRGQAFAAFGYDMIMAIYRAGGMPVPLPVVEDTYIPVQVAGVDGIVFSGGEDIHPSYYGGELQASEHRIDVRRDRYEMALMKAALEAEKPMLCICRGMQLLNVVMGGTLLFDIRESRPTALQHWQPDHPTRTVHTVRVKEDDFAESVLGKGEFEVNSIHHQGIDRVGEGLDVIAESPDGIAEALALKNRSHVLAVQWHPEFLTQTDRAGLKLFQWLVRISGSVQSSS